MHMFAAHNFSNSIYMFLLVLCIRQIQRQNFINNELSVLISAIKKGNIVNINFQKITTANSRHILPALQAVCWSF